MTVSNTKITAGPYIGDNLSDTFSYSFSVDNKNEVKVFETDSNGAQVELDVDIDYTVNGVGDATGGTITRLSGPLPTGYEWYIRSDYKETQETSFESQGAFYPDVHEKAFDKSTRLVQQLRDTLDRCFRVSDSYTGSGDLTIDNPVAGFLIRWKSDLTGFENVLLSELDPNIVAKNDIVLSKATTASIISDTSLVSGQVVKSLDKRVTGDGEGRTYVISSPVPLISEQDLQLDNGLVALQLDETRTTNQDSFRTFPLQSNFTHNWQFGGTQEHYLSKNAVIINGDSVTQGANAGYYMDNGYAYKLKRKLMEVYKTRSYGYLSVDDKDGFITTPAGAYRWYEPSTNGTLRQNQDAINSIGGTEVELGAAQFVKFEFNRQDKYSKDIIPAQKRYRVVWNDSTGSVRVTANGSNDSISDVILTNGDGISDVMVLPQSWDGTITITQESGTPVVNGIVLMESEDAYCVHMIYNGGRSHIEISDNVYDKLITGSDLYIHALGINDTFGETSVAALDSKIDTIISTLNASRATRSLILDLVWMRDESHFVRGALKRLVSQTETFIKLINIPKLLANGGDEYTTAELASDSIKFLSSDEVHPFLNGHSFITNAILSELGVDQDLQTILSEEERVNILNTIKTVSYEFGDVDLSKLIVGWTSNGSNSLEYTETTGTVATGEIFLGYIETKIPITEQQKYLIEIDIENISSTGVHNFTSRSLDALGNEIWQQDNSGGLTGNPFIESVSIPIGTRTVLNAVIGGRNQPSDSDNNKFEPNAAFWNLGMYLNNTDPDGQIRLHNIRITPISSFTEVTEITSFLGGWSASQGGVFIEHDKVNNEVSLHGFITGGGDNTQIFDFITAELRPAQQIDFKSIDENGALVKIRVETGGVIRVNGTGTSGWNTNVQLTGVKWKV